MDIRMPALDGLEATRRLLASGAPAPRVLILTTFDLDEYVYEALRAGASGFLLKSARPPELVAAVRAAVAGDTLLAPEITRRLVESYVRRPPPGTHLSQRARVADPARARGLAPHRPRALQRGDRPASLRDRRDGQDHASRIFMKLGVRDRTQAVILAYEHGIVEPTARSQP
jgi:DNA-binding NarL/FixJ family response regulator